MRKPHRVEEVICWDCGKTISKSGKQLGGGRSARHAARHFCQDCAGGTPKSFRAKYGFAYSVWAKYVLQDPFCDVCGVAITPPGIADHLHGHCGDTKHGCISCVRAKLCHACNIAEGFIAGMTEAGLIDAITGKLAVLHCPLKETPFQRWLRPTLALAVA